MIINCFFTVVGGAVFILYLIAMAVIRYWAPIAIVVILYVLAGCTTQTKVVDHYINVDRPVPVPCDVTIPDKPRFAVEMVKEGDSLQYIADAYMIDRRQRIGYEKKLEAALTTCVERPVKGTGAAQ